MFHDNRRWCVAPVESAEVLAQKLTEVSWCCCTGFELGGYLWLNDSTSADGAQEYAVVKKNGPNGTPVQIESITFGWCTQRQALEFIQRTLAGGDDDNSFRRDVEPLLQTREEHGHCGFCS